MQEALGEVQKQLEEAQQKSQLANFEEKHAGGGEQPGPSGLDTGRWNTLPFCSFVHEYALSTYVPPTPHLPGPTGTALPLGSLQSDVNSHCGV